MNSEGRFVGSQALCFLVLPLGEDVLAPDDLSTLSVITPE
jgi:hypothetical protein